jgi:hypothetical protein
MKKKKTLILLFFSFIIIIIKIYKMNKNNTLKLKEKYKGNNFEGIKLFYYNFNKMVPNAGDYFGRWLGEKMGYRIKFTYSPELVICGSILHTKYIKKNTKIWGVGFHDYNQTTYIKNLNPNNFYAIRGKLSLNQLNFQISDITLGDPGLLLSRFFIPTSKKKYDFCIISHFVDYNTLKQRFGKKYFIIRMNTNNIEEVANSINKCNFIFSSSLHGIIFSHSLGIPAVHLENKILTSQDNFKFKDYYSILNIPYIKEDLKKNDFNDIIKKYQKQNLSKFLPNSNLIKKIQDNLLSCFPFLKLNNIICTMIRKKNIHSIINKWLIYHFNLGFDHIYIFYNDKDYQNISDCIDIKIKNRVHFLNIIKDGINSKSLYISFYNKFKYNFKWCAFLEISEYIYLNKWKNRIKFLNSKFKNVIYIKLKTLYKQKVIYILRNEKLNKSIKFFFEKNTIIKGELSENIFNKTTKKY